MALSHEEAVRQRQPDVFLRIAATSALSSRSWQHGSSRRTAASAPFTTRLRIQAFRSPSITMVVSAALFSSVEGQRAAPLTVV